ncbi:outer membrane lipoprotein-sorting protein [Aquirufa sp.]|jgi:outer membrane lipoprotein-sorting protein|uniref:outer membrane lipoprotein-sorting protein n=1 Tax=Aquirufa sp. TaxID=2676249 RepID=UPI0037BFFFDD
MKNTFKALCLSTMVFCSLALRAQSTEEVLSKHQTAMGSPEKWSSVKSLVMKNKFSVQGMDIESKSSVLVGKGFRTEVEVMGAKIITAINGDSGWMLRPAMMGGTGEPEIMPADQVKMSASQKNIGSALIIAKKEGDTIELISKEKLDGADVYLLKVNKANGDESQVYVSASTYFIVKVVGKVKVNGQDVESEVVYSNYKAVDGLFFPHSMETASPMGGMMTVDTVSIEINPAIDEKIFAKPTK